MSRLNSSSLRTLSHSSTSYTCDNSIRAICNELYVAYCADTPNRIKLLDAFLLILCMMASMLMLHVCIAGSFPFNSFLAAFISCVGTFTLTLAMRIQIRNKEVFGISGERAFADYLICSLILNVAVFTFLG